MKPFLTSDFKIKFLEITPVYKDKTGVLNTQEMVAIAGLITFKGKSIKNILKEIRAKGENLNEKIVAILQKSSLIGHASMATTPTFSVAFEGSKFLDSALTGIIFSSSLMSSGRRTDTTKKDIIFPDKIFLNKRAKIIYQEISEKIINFFNFLLSKGVIKDEASKILQYGIYGTGTIQLPVESIVGLKREYQREKEWMPEEVWFLIKKIEKATKKLGVDLLYTTRELAPRNIYPYPNIFKNPNKSNLVREFRESKKLIKGSKLISLDVSITNGLKKKLEDLKKKRKETFSSLERIKKNWFNLLSLHQEIFRDYNLALKFKVLSSVPWRIWGEKKRHRTCPQIIESIYYCVGRAAKIFEGFKKQIEKNKINSKLLREIEEVFSLPPSIRENQEFLSGYLLTALQAFESYQKLIKLKIKPRDAIFLIPRGVKIDILQEFDLYNLLTGYYPLRLCQTAEAEMKRNTKKEIIDIKNALAKKGYKWLNDFIGPKCEIVGFCPEEKTCGWVKGLVKNYNENFHRDMKWELRNNLIKNLKKLGK